MPTDLKWIERARRIGWEGTALLRKFHGSDLPQSVQQAIAAPCPAIRQIGVTLVLETDGIGGLVWEDVI
jgi:hypothetical protein